MSSKRCIVCLQAAANLPHVHLSLSPIFTDYRKDILSEISKLKRSERHTNALCSQCQVLLLRLTRLNSKFKTLAFQIKHISRLTKIRSINNVRQSILDAEWRTEKRPLGMNLRDHQLEGESSAGCCDGQPEEDIGCRNEADAEVESSNDATEDDTDVNGLVQVGETSTEVEESHDNPGVVASNEAGPSAKLYPANWLPKNLCMTRTVKQVSEKDFIYKEKYPFERTEFGYKCGLCSIVVMLSSRTSTAACHNMIEHFKSRHSGQKAKSAQRCRQMCIQVAPNRFQYGNYFIRKVDRMFKCEECGVVKKSGKAHSDTYGYASMLKHIFCHHENASKTYDCEHCGKAYNIADSLRAHKKTKHEQLISEFTCCHCDKSFGSRNGVKIHQRRKTLWGTFGLCLHCKRGVGMSDKILLPKRHQVLVRKIKWAAGKVACLMATLSTRKGLTRMLTAPMQHTRKPGEVVEIYLKI